MHSFNQLQFPIFSADSVQMESIDLQRVLKSFEMLLSKYTTDDKDNVFVSKNV